MSNNSSSTSNSNNFLSNHCGYSRVSVNISIAIAALKAVLLLPLCTLVLYLGHQRWRQQRSFKTASHSDIFTYHMVALELVWVLGCFCYFGGIYVNFQEMIIVGIFATFANFYGEALFHVLTCVERYLAVVHPITYLGLRDAHGVMIRNISILCVWLLCFGLPSVFLNKPNYSNIPFFSLLVSSLIVVSFCSLSILCVLFRPGPGERGGVKESIDQSKRRVFHTITAITGVLWLWFVGFLVVIALQASPLLSHNVSCVVVTCAGFFNLPSSVVLPLLYLHRAGKLSCGCYNNR